MEMSKNQNAIYALHGFLGTSTDWDCFKLPLVATNLFQSHKILTAVEFAKNFNKQFKGKEKILLGYSMGGRLALHTLVENPNQWKAAIIISAHPGLKTEGEKKERLKNDKKWLSRFQTEDFDLMMSAWNSLEIFKTTKNFKRNKSDITETILKQCLDGWSLGKQEDLRREIAKLPMPILWIVGELDLKFKDLSDELLFLHPKSRVWIAKNCSHRVAWETHEFETQINLFLEDL